MSTATHAAHTPSTVTGWVLRVVTAAALVVDAVIHLQLASGYQQAFPDGVGGGTMFRTEGLVALVVAAYLLLRGSRTASALALLVALSALAAVLVYRYANVPTIGPLPSMYEPVWFFKKALTAIAEAGGTLTAVAGLVLATRASRQ